MPTVLYVLTCLLVPPLWGFLMYLAIGWWERRRRMAAVRERLPPIDYTI